MKMRLRYPGILLILLFATSLLPAQNDCGCDPARTWRDDLEQANVVLLATCVGVTTNPIKGGMNAVFQVDSSWKRRIEPMTTVHTPASNQCGYRFREGERYLIFANKRHQTIETSVCEHNLPYAEVEPEVLSGLGEGFGPGRPGMSRRMNLLLVAMGVLSLLGVALIVLRKRVFGQKKK